MRPLLLSILLAARAATSVADGLPSGAAEVSLPAPGTLAWSAQNFPRIGRHTTYRVLEEQHGPVVQAVSDCSASALVLPLAGVDLRHTPLLRWRWKIEVAIDNPDERARGGDDFAARVYVMFPFDPSQASRWQRLRRAVAERLYGRPLPGDSLNYVWASRARPGSNWTSPYSERSRVIALRSGPGGRWRTETVDLLADHQRWLGEPQRTPVALALMTDTDDTCGLATAYFADFRLLARNPPGPSEEAGVR